MLGRLVIVAAAACAATGVNGAVETAGTMSLASDPIGEATVARSLGKARKCAKPTPRCKYLKGTCMTVEECRERYGEEARFIGTKGFCKPTDDSSAALFEPTKCGCCYKKTAAALDPIDVVGATSVDIGFEAAGVGAAFAGEPGASTDADKPATWASFSAQAGGALGDFNLHLGEGATQSSQGPWSASIPAEVKLECGSDGTCVGEASGLAHSPVVDRLIKPTEDDDPARGDAEGGSDKAFESAQIPVFVKLEIQGDMFGDELRKFESTNDPAGQHVGRGDMTASIELRPTEAQRAAGVEPFQASLPLAALIDWRLTPSKTIDDLAIYPWPFFERKRSLCLQPVRTKHRRCLHSIGSWCLVRSPFYTYSGQGLDFGKPGLEQQWGKVDVTFQIRDWIDINDVSGKYQAVTEDEMADLRVEVSTSGCVEMFFVRKFSPSSTFGGGACWSGGTASAKIITSDEQVACGVDITHLAHEVGHALGLRHPGGSNPDGDSGTLMCPSGWQRDNPRRNSRHNGDALTNPLLIHYWGHWTPDNHDCDSDANCGSCHAHIPPDSC